MRSWAYACRAGSPILRLKAPPCSRSMWMDAMNNGGNGQWTHRATVESDWASTVVSPMREHPLREWVLQVMGPRGNQRVDFMVKRVLSENNPSECPLSDGFSRLQRVHAYWTADCMRKGAMKDGGKGQWTHWVTMESDRAYGGSWRHRHRQHIPVLQGACFVEVVQSSTACIVIRC